MNNGLNYLLIACISLSNFSQLELFTGLLLLEKTIRLPAAVTVPSLASSSQSLFCLLSAFFPLTGKSTGKVCSLGQL